MGEPSQWRWYVGGLCFLCKVINSTYTHKTSHSCYMWISSFPQQHTKTPGRYICHILFNWKNQITAGIKWVTQLKYLFSNTSGTTSEMAHVLLRHGHAAKYLLLLFYRFGHTLRIGLSEIPDFLSWYYSCVQHTVDSVVFLNKRGNAFSA